MTVSPEYLPLSAGAASVAVAIISFVFGPAIKAMIEQRAARETHDQGGWTEAVRSLRSQVGDLRDEVDGLRDEVHDLRQQVTEKDRRIAHLETALDEQSHSLRRANGRIHQLEHAWPAGYSLPEPDPVHP